MQSPLSSLHANASGDEANRGHQSRQVWSNLDKGHVDARVKDRLNADDGVTGFNDVINRPHDWHTRCQARLVSEGSESQAVLNNTLYRRLISTSVHQHISTSTLQYRDEKEGVLLVR